jgi:hypothetical protein
MVAVLELFPLSSPLFRVVAFCLHRRCVSVRLSDSSRPMKSNSLLAIEGLALKLYSWTEFRVAHHLYAISVCQ